MVLERRVLMDGPLDGARGDSSGMMREDCVTCYHYRLLPVHFARSLSCGRQWGHKIWVYVRCRTYEAMKKERIYFTASVLYKSNGTYVYEIEPPAPDLLWT